MKHILVVDDNKTNLAIAKQELSSEYQVTPVISGFQALKFLEKKHPDLILLDISMPEMDGKETMLRIRNNTDWSDIPIIFLTADTSSETEAECLMLGADDYISKPFVPIVMKSRISRIIELSELRNSMSDCAGNRLKQINDARLRIIKAVVKAMDEKNEYTEKHSIKTAAIACEIARRMDLSGSEIKDLQFSALLHDIGRAAQRDDVYEKTEPLTIDDLSVIHMHPVIGSGIVKDMNFNDSIYDAVLYHHERYDGAGYPYGLRGADIPLYARIINAAAAYEAMSSERPYRSKLSREEIISEFEKGCGSQFDPEICRIFLDMIDNGSGSSDIFGDL